MVFYDGYNEVFQQHQDSTAGWPTHFNVDGVARSRTGDDAGAGSGDGSVVIVDVLDEDPTAFIDEVHTSERGARVVAGRMWESLRPQVEAAP
ncbi:MAG: hypothetical protein ACR2JF_17125 [Iamia sp.]